MRSFQEILRYWKYKRWAKRMGKLWKKERRCLKEKARAVLAEGKEII